VNELKDGLLEALKNATNIRNLKPDETITVCVFGGVSAVPAKVRVAAKPKPSVSEDEADELQVFLADRENGPPARGTIMTIRVKKSDVDAFAQGKLSADEFRTKAAIIAYAGDTGGWGGWGGGGGVFGLTPN